MDNYLTLTQLGTIYGTTRNQVGRWLKNLGLRSDDGQPTRTAHREGYVEQRPSTQPGTYFYAWHKERTCQLLDNMGYPRA